MNKNEIQYIMDQLFPMKSEYNKQFNEYYSYRQMYFNWNINSEAYTLHKQYNDFPDPSYHWVYPEGMEPKDKHVLFGTYYIQHKLWEHQFPSTCEDKKFLIVPTYNYGIGSIIHVLTLFFAFALNTNRIIIAKPLIWNFWDDEEFCDKEHSILCYFESLTNCRINEEDIKKAFNHNTPFIGTNHAHISNYNKLFAYSSIKYIFISIYNLNLGSMSPNMINEFLNKTSHNYDSKWYWRIQGATFITRLNKKTLNWIHEYEKEKCSNCQNEYDISLYIRHGDKGREMKLVGAYTYKEAIKIIAKAENKQNYTIYVNGDDQESINIIHSLPYSVISFNYSRKQFEKLLKQKQNHIALRTFADLYHQVRANHIVGTIGSNRNRLAYELKMTVGMKSNGYILEVGNEKCVSYSHCSLMKTVLNTKWR